METVFGGVECGTKFVCTRAVVGTEGRSLPMRIVVDLNLCLGYAQCVFLAPDVFTLSGEEALMYDPAPDEAQREQVMRAAAALPEARRRMATGRARYRIGPEHQARAACRRAGDSVRPIAHRHRRARAGLVE